MTSYQFKRELAWFGTGLAVAGVTGLLLNALSISLLTFTVLYLVWTLKRLDSIVSWLQDGGKARKAPFSHGLTEEMVRLIHREKKYSQKQKNRFKSALGQFNSLASSMPDAIIVLNDNDEIRWSNPAAKHLVNIHPERDRGQRIDNLIRNPLFSEFLSNEGDSIELEVQGALAIDRMLELRRVGIKKNLTALICADITQRAKVREMRKTFVADVSHELRTPLTVISGYLEMLQENTRHSPEVSDALREVGTQSARMHEIVEALLELSKLEANPLGESEGEVINVGGMLRSLITTLQKESPQHKFALELDDSLALLGTEREIYSACNNLLTNAVKYTNPGTVITVSWGLDENGDAVYSVTDNGPGIELRHLSRLSERFYRVDTGRSREQGGTGLGLAIVKHAVQRHGGSLNIQSQPGTGSTFSATFPGNRVHVLQQIVNQ